MSMNGNHESLSDLERQVDDQRQRVEQRINDIQDKLSPGQLLDQALRYTRNGGADFASTLGSTITANPVPVVLLGVSIAWLMAGPKHPTSTQQRQNYPYARVSSAGLQRTRHERDERGEWYSHFIDEAGTEYRARADETGRRVGHFVDTAGKSFNGFIDDAGHRVDKFRDEAGNALDEAADWAAHTLHDIGDAVGNMAGEASQIGASLQRQAGNARRSVADLLHEQPLVAGALAFAAGAALGASLPPTEQEDELLGRQSDDVKRSAEETAAQLYREGKSRAKDLHDDAAEAVESAYEGVKDAIGGVQQDQDRPN